ncbi:sensor histidine kinase [Psychrobium sp. MM17-31]|uniref:sensor histidine kinase n=1 Tax=Psychrobium sp. MM17-31 TaxID=2917758 RepID=UPI001EF3FD3C|nr:sensor histidine kinase [Psychrobium sp. MM17-31]MCG7531910.1 sensor histidine kinase [Psychrobium sp. MM17-31]
MSIRTYLFASLAGLVLLISAFLSFQSAKIFIGAFQMASEDIMIELGLDYHSGKITEPQVLDYYITSDWQQVPSQIKRHFPSPELKPFTLHTRFIDWNYISPPNHIYSLVVVKKEGSAVYISRYKENLRDEIAKEHPDEFFIDPMVMIILIGSGFFILFLVTLWFVFKKVARPMESLRDWASNLTIDNINEPLPAFRFKELNELATLIHHNYSSLTASVERERKFLSYASHELRTPIAVLRSNCSLLEKVNASPSDKERLIRERINRASLTMKSMTETLLWLSRDEAEEMPTDDIELGQLIEQSFDELNYLTAGKSIEVAIERDDSVINLATTPVTLVVNNLIRNALQHTQQGTVAIHQANDKIIITNVETAGTHQQFVSELGFGLGNQLIQNLINRFGWKFDKQVTDNQYRVMVKFSSPNNEES